jgi:hypothetical protein
MKSASDCTNPKGETMNQQIEKALERFKANIEVDTATGCHNWTGGSGARGYAQFYLNGKMHRAARWLYETTVGAIPEGLEISHRCHNRKCTRIHADHVIIETHAENMRRSAMRGAWRGERNGKAKLNHAEVRLMRELYQGGGPEVTPTRLSQQFGVSLRTVYNVINYETYENVIPAIMD